MVDEAAPAQNRQPITDTDLQAAIYFAVGVASEGSLRGRNVAYEISFAGYIHNEGDTARRAPREAGTFHEGQLEPVYNSGYSIGTLQTDFGQQRNDPNRNADRLLNAYQAWAQTQAAERPELVLNPQEFEQASQALHRQGNEIRGDRTTTADNGYDIPDGIKTRLNTFMASDAGITYVHNQDVSQVNHLLRQGGAVRALEGTTLYQNASQDNQIRMATVIAKLENQDGNRHWPGIIRQINDGSIDSLDGIKAGVPQHLHGDRDNALRGAEVVIALRNSDAQNPLHSAWQHVAANPLANPTQLNQDSAHPNLQAEYSTVKNLLLVPDQGKALVQVLDAGGQRARDIRFQGAPGDQTAGFYASGNDFVLWNRDGHGHANIGGQWSDVERAQVTRSERNGVVDLDINRNGTVERLLHIDPATPVLRPPGATPPAPAATAPVSDTNTRDAEALERQRMRDADRPPSNDIQVPANPAQQPGPPAMPLPRQPGPADRDHPDHAMLEQIRAGVRKIDEGIGKPYDEMSERISRSLLAACKDNRDAYPNAVDRSLSGHSLSQVDHVVMGKNGNIFAVEGRLDSESHKRAYVSVEEAIRIPVEQSDTKVLAANQTMTQERELARQQELARGPDDPSKNGPKMS